MAHGGNNGQGSKWIRPERRTAIYARDAHACVYCGATAADSILTLDHVMPRVLGGGNESGNLVTACLHCNSARKALSIREFARTLADDGIDPMGVARRVRNATKRQLPQRRTG